MPKLRSETNSAGDQRWRASNHGVTNARTYTMDAAKFADIAKAHKGVVPSGYPLAVSGEKAVPHTAEGGDPFIGHLLTDQDATHGDIAVPVYYQGAVHADRVPLEGFTAPAAQPHSTIAYL